MMKKLYTLFLAFYLTACTNLSPTKEFWINNPQNEKIYIKAEGLENSNYQKLAIIQHGLASNMEHPAVQAAKKAFLDNNYVVITFDSRYSLGKGDNEVEKVSLATFADDLETVANWAGKQNFYREPFALAGHSLGGASAIKFASNYPNKISALIPITPVVSGKNWEKSCMENLADFCQQWKKDGEYQYTDAKNHKTAIIPYSVITSCNSYDAYKLAPKIEADTLLIAAEKDIIVNPSDVVKLAKGLKKGNVSKIKDSGHNFENLQNQAELHQAIDKFLK